MSFKSLFTIASLFWTTMTMAQGQEAWVGTWAAAAEFTGQSDMPKAPLTNRSLREIVRVSVAGDCLKLRLSNEFSKQPVEIKSVFIADALDSCDIVKKSARYLTFGGKKAVTIAPGECAMSDVCKYALRPLGMMTRDVVLRTS